MLELMTRFMSTSVNKYCLYSPGASSLTSLVFGIEEEKNGLEGGYRLELRGTIRDQRP
jgi:hypothetical protein